MASTPAIKPHFTSFPIHFQHGRFLEKLKCPSIMNYGEPYTEVQYHGQLRMMDDVESVLVSKHNGLYPQEINEVRKIFKKYKKQHPKSAITLKEF